jgi:ribosomal-protein-alanine acetyltransferase
LPADLPFLVRMERECPTAGHWSEDQYRDLFSGSRGGIERLALVAEGDPSGGGDLGRVGFLVARSLVPEWELENIVVAASAQRMGVGTRLCQELVETACQRNSTMVFLEVRESNFAARELYKKLGFQETGRRRSYYASPLEDAILYSLNLAKPFK